MTRELLTVLAAYLLGSLPTALLAVRVATGADVRAEGSGNVGATNAARSAGLGVGALVTIVDISKGVASVVLMRLLTPESRWLMAATAAAVIGHCFPVWLRFRGGKGVATIFGAYLVLAPAVAGAGFAVWIAVLLTSRYVALASLTATATLPLWLALLTDPPLVVLAGSSALAALLVALHWSNIRNLVAGTEERVARHHLRWRRRR